MSLFKNDCLRLNQRTLKNAIHCSGVGLHSGARITMTLHPAEADHGIVFVRSDRRGAPRIAATWDNAIETPLCSTLVGAGGIKVATVEHLLSAFAGCGIDNVLVELDGAEVPIMDGSAAPFVFLIECAGTLEQPESRRALKIVKTVEVVEPHRAAMLAPASPGATSLLEIDFEIDFDSPLIARQSWRLALDPESYRREICRARTFGFLHEVDQLRARGLGLGGSLDNAIIIDGKGILNEGGLRYENEFVRHKILDSIGDLYLAGGPIAGSFTGRRAGHALTLRLLKTLFADKSAWRWVRLDETLPALAAGALPARAVAARA